jgi:hypothetical protein
MRETRIKLKRRMRSSERSDRGDYNFAVATIALMLFFLIAGSSAWIESTSSLKHPLARSGQADGVKVHRGT